MDIQTEKLRLIEQLLKTDDIGIISKMKAIFFKQVENDIWDELTESQKLEVEKAIKEVANGDVVDYDSIVAKYR